MDNTARVIHEIPANPALLRHQTKAKKLRVAAYCRVSTDDEEQLTSYEAQIEKYTQTIGDNPDWTLVEIFADEGITGTSTKKRDEFNRMMSLCKRGKIDLIITKSISRFARNTLDAISHVRNLKTMNIGVMFEKENINTLTMTNEMIFTILSAFAQAESESISENVKWGKRHAMKQGKVPFQYTRILGYERGEDNKPKIVPEQAETVRRIFASYLAGYSVPQIKAELDAERVPAACGNPVWSTQKIQYMLKNEKYIGDALLQKTYVVDCISKQMRKNRGEIAQYYIENNHEGIIPRKTFHMVQEEIARRSAKRRVTEKALSERGKYSGKYALSELLVCGECGTHYRRVTWAKKDNKKFMWRCISRLENGTRHCKESPSIEEYRLHDAIIVAINQILHIRDDVIEALKDTMRVMTDGGNNDFDRLAAQQKISELEKNAAGIIELSKNEGASQYFDEPLEKIYAERTELLRALDEDEKQREKAYVRSARLERLVNSLQSAPLQIDAYDDIFIRAIVERITVIDTDHLIIVLKGGFDIEATMTE